jgi:hypothetical protein
MRGLGVRAIAWLCGLALPVGVCVGIVHYAYLPDTAARRPSADPRPAETPALPPLDEGQRTFLWEVEHHGNLLSRVGFRILADALQRGDARALDGLLAADFAGADLGQADEVHVVDDFVDVTRRRAAGLKETLSRESFLARLLAYRALFTLPPKVQLALMALAPQVRIDLDSPWEGTCQLRMWGETGPGHPGEVVLYLSYQVTRPSEATLRTGGWLHACTFSQSQTARAPRFLLREAAAERGIDVGAFHDNWKRDRKESVSNSGGVYLCDYDRDGFLDLFVADINRLALYKGLPGGRFKDVTAEVGLPRTAPLSSSSFLGIMAAFVDLDGDGWEDLILGDRIYRNEGGRRFVDYTYRTNLRLPLDGLGVAAADFDRDGRMDLYVIRSSRPDAGSWLSGKSGEVKDNQLWRNLGNWQFENVTARSGAGGGGRSTFSAVWLDANNDGWPDLYVINEFGNGVLYVNNGDGTFRDHALADGPSDFGSMGVTCGDIDNDGNIDLYIANMYSKAGSRVIGNLRPGTYPEDVMARMRRFVTGSQLYHNRGGLRFEPLGQQYQVAAVGWAYGPALVDLDNDGWLDLYATCGFISQSRGEPDG